MVRKVRLIPQPALDTLYDDFQAEHTNHIGGGTWECYGAPDNTTTNVALGATISADNILFKMRQLDRLKPTGWVLGRSKAIVSSWEQKMKWTNLSNQPMKLHFYTLVTRRNVPTANSGQQLGYNGNILEVLDNWFNDQYAASLANIDRTLQHPAFKLSDVAKFNFYWRVARITTRTIQPGQTFYMRKYKRRPETINTAKYYDIAFVGGDQACLKGQREYMWRIEADLVESKAGSDASIITPAYNFFTSYHYRFAYLANDVYNFQPPAIPNVIADPWSIYPGTSTATALAPAV